MKTCLFIVNSLNWREVGQVNKIMRDLIYILFMKEACINLKQVSLQQCVSSNFKSMCCLEFFLYKLETEELSC